MEVVAEGVETFAQLHCLRGRGADLVQGISSRRRFPRAYFSGWSTPSDPFGRENAPLLMEAAEPAVDAPAKVA